MQQKSFKCFAKFSFWKRSKIYAFPKNHKVKGKQLILTKIQTHIKILNNNGSLSVKRGIEPSID